tara:strand:- start:155 stop:616 length:462 start_codon:yes stop_codon:yes gene_type:complete
MSDETFALIWILSFGLYFLIYTFWIPLKTQRRIENWLRDSESDETLLLALDVIVKRIREQTLVDFEEFMLPQARENLQKFWAGAMGNVAKEMKNSEEGSNLNMLHNIANELSGQPWYVQALGSKLMPIIQKSIDEGKGSEKVAEVGMGLLGKR